MDWGYFKFLSLDRRPCNQAGRLCLYPAPRRSSDVVAEENEGWGGTQGLEDHAGTAFGAIYEQKQS